MPELIESDHDRVASAFQQFRAGARTEIRAPGSELAKRTVARRRHTRVAAIAGAVAITLLGGWLAVARGPLGGPPPADPVRLDHGPTLDGDELQRLAEQALGRLGYAPSAAADKQPVRPGMLFGPLRAEDQSTYRFGDQELSYPAGTYQVQGVCLGRGRVEVTWETSGQVGTFELFCRSAAEAEIRADTLSLAGPGTITVARRPDAEAAGRAGWALALSDPRLIAARGVLGPHTDAQLVQSEGGGSATNRADSIETFAPGHYRLTVACSGSGDLRATLKLDALTESRTVACSWHGGRASLDLTSASGGAEMWVLIEGEGGLGNAAFAYRLEELS